MLIWFNKGNTMIWFEIKWFFKMNWPYVLLVALILAFGIPVAQIMKNYEPPPERITVEAQGVILGIRNTGAWNVNDTEIKFTDGSIFLLRYSTVLHYKLKHGQNIRIIYSSYRGRVIEINSK